VGYKVPLRGPKVSHVWGSATWLGGRSIASDGLGLEAVAHAWLGEEVAGAGRLLLQLAAELGDVDAQVVGLGAVGGAPHVLE
jgi:hypothetical protein